MSPRPPLDLTEVSLFVGLGQRPRLPMIGSFNYLLSSQRLWETPMGPELTVTTATAHHPQGTRRAWQTC